MVGRARTAMKFFVYGLAVGILFAPRSGAETRQEALDWIGRTAKELLGGGGGSNAA